MIARRTFLTASAAVGATALFGVKAAQSAPTARIVVGFLPGGLTDIVARRLADGLNQANLDHNVIVENRPGATGRIAIMNVKTSPADGTSLLFAGSDNLSLGPHVFSNIEFDPIADFVPVNSVISFGFCLSVGPAVPEQVKTLENYLAWVKENPDKATYGGVLGTPQNLLTAQFSKAAGVELTLAAFKGGGPQMTQDVLRGDVPAATQVVGDVLQWQGPDKLRTLAIFSAKRSPFLPDVPTIGEAGFPDLVFEEWMAVFAPKGTPQAELDKWSKAIVDVVTQPSFAEGLKAQGAVPDTTNGPGTAAALKKDYEFWENVVETTGIRIQD
ncbi:Bug family tripartite tricarboxylate transporter substrate binding protein [Mesorhizobium sp. A556]